MGPSTGQSVNEVVFSPTPGTCSNGHPGFIATLIPGTGHSVTRFDFTGDLLFSEHTSITLCFDTVTGTQFFSGAQNITGGTGRLVGATGSFTFSGTATTLFEDAAGNFFGQESGTVNGTIITP